VDYETELNRHYEYLEYKWRVRGTPWKTRIKWSNFRVQALLEAELEHEWTEPPPQWHHRLDTILSSFLAAYHASEETLSIQLGELPVLVMWFFEDIQCYEVENLKWLWSSLKDLHGAVKNLVTIQLARIAVSTEVQQ